MGQYVCSIPFKDRHADSIVVCCSDGRTQKHVSEFLEKHDIEADLFAVPGGPLVLAGGVETFQDAMLAERRLQFMAERHGTQRVILISHGSENEECACGMARKMWPRVTPAERVSRQKEALLKGAQKLSAVLRLPVFSFFANVVDDMVQFEEVKAAGQTADMPSVRPK